MVYHPSFVRLHIFLAGFWLANIAAFPIFKREIKKACQTASEKTFILLNLVIFNILGSVLATGIFFTGMLTTVFNSNSGFINYLTNQQFILNLILLIAALILIVCSLIPRIKKIVLELEKEQLVSDSAKLNVDKINRVSFYINILVVINLLFTLCHYFFE